MPKHVEWNAEPCRSGVLHVKFVSCQPRHRCPQLPLAKLSTVQQLVAGLGCNLEGQFEPPLL